MNINLSDLLFSVNFDLLVFGSSFVNDDLTLDISDFDNDLSKLIDYLHRNGLFDSVVYRFKIFNDISSDFSGVLCLWIKEWSV